MAANPGIDLEMDVTNKTKVLQSIKNNEVDFSLISVLPDDMLLEQEELLKNPLFLTGAPGRDFFPDKVLDKSVFTDLPLIFREQGSATRAVMQRYFSKIHIVPKARFELTSNEAVKQAVMGGLGYSIISLLSIKHELMQQAISIINVRDLPLMENWRLVWHPQRKMSIVAGAFIDYIRINKAEIFRVHFKWIEKYILPHPET
jgi:DNA-binding transcriptional LysR family regulator